MDITNKNSVKDFAGQLGDEYKEIFNQSPIGIIFHDKKGIAVNANNSALKIMGIFRLDDILGINLFDNPFIAGKKEELIDNGVIHFQAPLDLDMIKDLGFYIPTKNGVLFLDYTVSVTDSGFLVQIQDITERNRVEEREEYLRALMDNNPSLVFMKDKFGRYVYLNDAYEKQFVHSKDWYGKTDFDFWPKESAELFQANDDEVLKSGKIHQFLEDSTDRDGTRYVWLNYKFPFIDSKNKRYVGGIGIDVTDRVCAEEALSESEEKFHSLFELPLIGMGITSPDKSWIEANDKICDILGYSHEELLKTTWDKITYPDDLDKDLEQFNKLLNGYINSYNLEKRFIRKDGSVIYTNLSGGCIRNEDNSVKYFVVMIEDITYPKKAEKQIKRRNTLLNGINKVFEQSLISETEEEVAVTCLNVANMITKSKFGFVGMINEKGNMDTIAIDKTGWEMCEAPLEEAIKLTRNMKVQSYWGRVIKEGKSQIVNDTSSDRDRRGVPEGHPQVNLFLGVPFKQAGKPIGLIGLANKKDGYTKEDKNDIETLSVAFVEALMRKKAEIQLKESNDNLEDKVEERTVEIEEAYQVVKENEFKLKDAIKELERSNRELQSFAYITSHDLQEPLRTIASFTQLLERRYKGQFDSDADEFMDYIVEASIRMKRMIQGLLDYSRVGTQGGEFKDFNAEEALNQALSNLHSSISKCNVELIYDQLPLIHADESQISRVFQNLIGNALKFRKKGVQPKIHIKAQKEGYEYIFSVQDNGIGMEKQYTDRIFEVFKRLHTIDEYKGAGIGLAIVKRIIERHGGRIWVESEYGEGSTFYFTIPVEPVKSGGDS